MDPPIVFISYSHESEEHKEWVRRLASDLRSNRIEAILDQWELRPGQDVVRFMENGITKSVRVLMICTSDYVSRAEGGVGGVGYERLIITQELVAQIDTRKFLPIVRANDQGDLPAFLGPRLFVDFRDDSTYSTSLNDLVLELHNRPRYEKPPLGQNPFSSVTSEPAISHREASEVGRDQAGESILDSEWFATEATTARNGLFGEGHRASMELRFGLHSPVSKSQMELLNAVRSSEIHTFGWPIAITIETRDDLRPRPYTGGIRAEIKIDEIGVNGESSYDYWSSRENGDFYLLKTLFEDQRRENEIFFNTRIVRVAESLMFAGNLYENLGVPGSLKLSTRITHDGLKDRVLSTSSRTRHVSPAVATEPASSVEFVASIRDLREDTSEYVFQVLEPMFMLFDFKQFDRAIYDDIVDRYRNGEVT